MCRLLLLFGALNLFGAFLTACGSAGDEASARNGMRDSVSSVGAPEFSGPYAAEYADAYARAESDLARRILAHGEITESDVAEVRAAEAACLADHGFTNLKYHPDGTSEATQPEGISDDEANEIHKQCTISSGSVEVDTLYNTMLVNPNNEDWDALCVQCLIAVGAVEASFTVEELNSWYANDDPRLSVPGSAVNECTTDPWGTLQDR